MSDHQNPVIGSTAGLEEFRIQSLPSAAYYIPDFITKEEEKIILNKVATAPKPRWKTLTHRRLQAWPGELTKDTLLAAGLPNWLVEPVIPRLLNLSVDKIQGTDHIFSESPHGSPNHVLINEYLPGQGIMPHKDGSAYYPVVCTVSLGAALCLDIYGTNEQGIRMAKPSWRILQEPRSLLITTDDLYKHYLHGIADITIDEQLNQDTVANWSLLKSRDNFPDGNNERHVRTSLTYRDVLKVSKLGNKLGLLGRR